MKVYQIYQRHTTVQVGKMVDAIALSHAQRRKGRQRVRTLAGDEAQLFLTRGQPLAVGEVLQSEQGELLQVQGAKESVVTATTEDWFNFAQVCYHLGNRHQVLQIGERWLRFLPDDVLEDLVQRYGLQLHYEQTVFEPENGAYHPAHSHEH